MKITTINPATNEPIRDYTLMESSEVRKILAASNRAYTKWRRTSFAERAELMRAGGRVLRERAPEFARLMTAEMGKPVKAARAEAEKCATV